MKSVFITGTSSGIGLATAEILLKKGYTVFGTVRKEKDGEKIREYLGDNYIPIICDVTKEDHIQQAFEFVSEQLNGKTLGCLINNAGIAIGGPVRYQSLEEIRSVFEVNFFGTLRVTQTFFPLLLSKENEENGRIIMISSVAGKVGYPFLGAYVASKHALEGITDSLRRECLVNNVKVVLIEPGDTRTTIWDKAEKQDPSVYANTEYYSILKRFQKMFIRQGKTGIPVEKVAEVIVRALENPKPKPRYVIPNGRFAWMITRYLPDRMVDRLMAKFVGLYSQ